MSITTWLASMALSVGQKKIIEFISTNTLSHRLREVAVAWSQSLPANSQLLSVDAIFVPKTSLSVTEQRPLSQVLPRLAKHEIPTSSEWTHDLLNQWKWVRRNTSEKQEFFNIPEQDAEAHLSRLGNALELECQKDKNCFQVTMLQRQNEMAGQLQSLSMGMENLSDRLLTVMTEQFPTLTKKADSESGSHAEIDTAVAFLKTFQPDVAIAQLELLRTRKWDVLTDRERYRLVANLGHARLAKSDMTEAGRFFIDAKQYQPADEQARALEAIGYSLLENRPHAFELATSLRKDFPNSTLAAATWVRNAPNHYSLEDLEASLSSELREDVEVACALAWRATLLNCMDQAEEYARCAFAFDPKAANLQELLALVLLQSVRYSVREQFADRVFIPDPTKLREAIDLLNDVLKQLSSQLPRRIPYIRFHLGLAESLRGNTTDAVGHLFVAWDSQKNDPDYARQYSLCLHDRDDLDGAIRVLEGAVFSDKTGKDSALFASLLLERNQDKDLDRAQELLDSLISKLDQTDVWVQFEILNSRLYAYWKENDSSNAESLLNRISNLGVAPYIVALLDSIKNWRFGNSQQAVERAKVALSQLPTNAPKLAIRRLALQLSRLALDDDALSLWKTLVQPNVLGFDTIEVIRVAARCQDVLFLQSFTRELRRNGIYERNALHLEIDMLQEYHCFDTAISVMQEILVSPVPEPLQMEIRVRLAHLSLAIAHADVPMFSLSQLPSPESVEPVLGIAAVEVLSHGPTPTDAVRYAYRLLRSHFDSHLAHRAMVVSILGARGRKLDLDDPTVVEPGSAVKYREADATEDAWFIIEDEPDADASRREFPVSHQISQAMLGKQRGDQFQFQPEAIRPQFATIVDIWSKYKYRFNECMEEWKTRFPDHFFLWQVRMKCDTDGKPQFDEFFQSIDDKIATTNARDAIYRDNPLSATNYALVTGVSVLDSIRHLSHQAKLPIRCCVGNSVEVTAAYHVLDNSRPLILDGSALATLFLTEGYRSLASLGRRLIVSYGTLIEWRKAWIAAERSTADRGFVTKQGKKYLMFADDPDALRRHREAIKDFLDFLNNSTTVEEGLALARLGRDERIFLTDFLGRPAAESIAIAVANGYAIWTDDRWVGEIAVGQHGLQRVWTGTVLMWGTERRLLAEQVHSKVIVDLLRLGYVYTQLTPSVFQWAGESDLWSPAGRNLAACLDWLANPYTMAPGILQVGLHALSAVYHGASSDFARTTLITQIESKIRQRPDGFGILRSLFRQIDHLAGLDVIMRKELKDVLRAWENITSALIG